MAHSCPHCHHTFRSGRVFCPNCGALVGAKKSKPHLPEIHEKTVLSLKKFWQREEKASYLLHALQIGGIALFIVIFLSLLIWVMWYFMAAKTPIASYLPRDTTIIAIEGDINPYNRQFRAWSKLFSNTSASLNTDRIRIEVNAMLSSLDADYDELFDAHAGYALIEYSPSMYAHVFVMKIRDRELLEDITTLTIGTRIFTAFIEDDYFFLVSDAVAVPMLGKTIPDRLSESDTYQSLAKTLRPYGLLHIYTRPTAMYNATLTMNNIPWMYDIRYTLFASVFAQSTAIMTDIRVEKESLVAHTVTAYAHEGQLPVTIDSSTDLLRYIELTDSVALVGSNFGHNIATIRDSADISIQSIDVPFTIFLQQITETTSLSMEQIGALLDGPYVIGFGNSATDIRVGLQMNQTDATALVGYIRSALVAFAPSLSPKRVTVQLRDGTIADEYIVNPLATVVERKEAIGNETISILEIPESKYKVVYLYKDNMLYLASDAQKLADALLAAPPAWVENYKPHSKNGQSTIVQLNVLDDVFAKSIAEPSDESAESPWNSVLKKLYPYIVQFSVLVDEGKYTWDEASHITTVYR